MVQLVEDTLSQALDFSEILDPCVLGEIAFEFDQTIIVMSMKRFAITFERGHVGGSESETVAFDGDSAGGRHGSILAEAE